MKYYYQILELPLNASPRRIKEQYRKLAKRYHPDRVTDPAAKARYADKFREINNAYEALSDIVRRGSLKPAERKLDFLYHKGKSLFEQKQWAKALVVFNEIAAIDSSYRDTLTRLRETRRMQRRLTALYVEADNYFQQKNWSEAMSGFEVILREDAAYRDAAKKYKKARRERLTADFMNQR